MATEFKVSSFFTRWLFSLLLVFGTYNPTEFSYVNWVLSGGTEFGPVTALTGVALVIAWIVFLRATLMSIGWLGIALGAALFGCLIWLLIDIGLVKLGAAGALIWIVLVVLSLILAAGMSWSHIRRRLTGQVDIDELDD